MSIHEALTDLRDELKAGTEIDEALDAVAEDHGLNRSLLLRKFEESFGMHPAEWAVLQTNRSETQVLADKKARLKVMIGEHNSSTGARKNNAARAAFALADEIGANISYR